MVEPGVLELSPDEFDRWRSSAGEREDRIGAVESVERAFTIRVVLDDAPDWATVATYAIPKLEWDAWSSEAFREVDVNAVRAVASTGPLPPIANAGIGVCEGDSWSQGALDPVPDRRYEHTAVWTGAEMIVWGGRGTTGFFDTGLRYDPATDSWSKISSVGAPSGRFGHAAVWTGEVMVVWGARSLGPPTNTGGQYDPATDSWSPTSLIDAPAGRIGPTGVWTGDVVIFWGGSLPGVPFTCNCCTGGFAVGCDSFTCETAVCDVDPFCCDTEWDTFCDAQASSLCTCCESAVATGGRYDPVADAWLPMSPASTPRASHTAVWTGTEMIVWGGSSTKNAERYDPASDSWTETSDDGAPSARTDHSAVWTGDEMIVWGGFDDGTDAWRPGAAMTPLTDTLGRA